MRQRRAASPAQVHGRGLDLKAQGPEEQEMIEIWLQTFALIALAYAVTTMVFPIRSPGSSSAAS